MRNFTSKQDFCLHGWNEFESPILIPEGATPVIVSVDPRGSFVMLPCLCRQSARG